MNRPAYATHAEAARACGLSPSTIGLLVARGAIESVAIPRAGGRPLRRIRREALEAYVAAGCPRPPREPCRPRVPACLARLHGSVIRA